VEAAAIVILGACSAYRNNAFECQILHIKILNRFV
jgi:hypothetical protein